MAASETLALVDLDLGDVDAGMILSTEAGWNQTADDWRHFIARGRAIGVRDATGRLVASAAALPYEGPFGFIGMVLVTPDFRRRGIATDLVDRCISDLTARGLTPVLDATAAGAEVYRKQGFLPQFGFDRWQGTAKRQEDCAADRSSLETLAELDRFAFGAGRAVLFDDFLRRDGTRAVLAEAGDGFAMIRRGRRALQAGPVVSASEDGALGLLENLLAAAEGVVFIDVPSAWHRIGAWLAGKGFSIQRSFTRMALGQAKPFGAQHRLFALAGPEFG